MYPIRLFLLAMLALVSFAAHGRGGPLFAVPEADKGRTDLATLVLPVSLDIEMVDGIVYAGTRSVFRKGDVEVRILPGAREVALKYNQLFQLNADNHEIIRSKIVVLTFVAEPGKVYRATHEKFRNVDAAREGVKNFVVTIEDAQGANQVVSASQVQKDWKGEATTTSRKDLVSVSAAAAVTPAAPAAGGLNALDLLKFTWQNAGAADRAAFLEWVKANP